MIRKFGRRFFQYKFELAIFLIFWILAFLMIATYTRLQDDANWISMLDERGLWGAILYCVKVWQPRFTIDTLQLFFDLHLTLWKIVNSFCLTISVFFIYKLSAKNVKSEKNKLYIMLAAFSAFWLIYGGVLWPGYIWMAGSPVYNMAFTAMIVSAIPFIYLVRDNEKLLNRFSILPFIILVTIPCYCEQPSVILTGLSILMIVITIYSKRKVPKLYFIYCGWIMVNSVLFNILNFSSPRISGDTHSIPEFQMLSLMDKLFQAITYVNQNVIHVSGFLFLGCAGLTAYVLYKKYTSLLRYIGFIPFIYALMGCIPFESFFSLGGLGAYIAPISSNFFGYGIYSSSTVSDFNIGYAQLCPAMASIFVIVLFGLLLFLSFENIQEKIIVAAFYAGGLLVTYALGFTAAFFGIAGRGFFFINLIMLLIFVSQTRVAIHLAEDKLVRKAGAVFIIFCMLFLIRTVIQFVVLRIVVWS